MTNLTQNWVSLIKKESGVDVIVKLIGEDKAKIFVKGESFFDVFNMLIPLDINFDVVDDGILVTA